MNRRWIPLLLALTLGVTSAPPRAGDDGFTTDFPVDECDFSDHGSNPYFSLNPGDWLLLESDEDDETLRLKITVLPGLRWIQFLTPEGDSIRVRTRVVEEREWVDGELVEVSRNFFARCRETGDIYYFGEQVDIYQGGRIVSHDGAWRAGLAGAQPGIIMPGSFLLGARYYQEQAPDVALDRGEHDAMSLELETPAGEFEGCVRVVETSALSAGESVKHYCEEVGLVDDDGAVLVDYRRGDDDEDDDD